MLFVPWKTRPLKKQCIRVLMIEDSPDDVDLLSHAVQRLGAPIELDVAGDGDEALRILHEACSVGGQYPTDLILLDLNMPKKSGLEVLREIKGDRQLRQIPIVIVTASRSPSSIEEAYRTGAACYFAKPADFEEMKGFVRNMCDFWKMVCYPVK